MAGERTLPGIGLTGFWDLGSAYKTGMDTNLRLLSALVQPSVASTLAAEPGAPADGDMHIASAAWGGGAANDIMVRDSGAWVAITPQTGWQVYDRGDSARKTFDGTTWAAAAAVIASYDIRFGFQDTPAAGAVIDTIIVVRDVTLPADLAGSLGAITTNPTASFQIDVEDDGTVIGTVTISTAGAFTFATTGGTEKVIAAGSVLTIAASATADATAAGATITLLGSA